MRSSFVKKKQLCRYRGTGTAYEVLFLRFTMFQIVQQEFEKLRVDFGDAR